MLLSLSISLRVCVSFSCLFCAMSVCLWILFTHISLATIHGYSLFFVRPYTVRYLFIIAPIFQCFFFFEFQIPHDCIFYCLQQSKKKISKKIYLYKKCRRNFFANNVNRARVFVCLVFAIQYLQWNSFMIIAI